MKTYLYTIIAVFLVLFSVEVKAQDPVYLFHNQHMNIVNPAAVGREIGSTISMNIRKQWTKALDAPQTHTLFFTTALSERIGLGVSILNDKIFVAKLSGFYADFSYNIPVTRDSRFVMGLKAGGDIFNFEGSRLEVSSADDPYLQNNFGSFQPNIGIGVMYDHPDFYVGAGIPNLLASDKSNLENGVMTAVSEQPHLYLNGGYRYAFTDEWAVKPSVQSRFAQKIESSHSVMIVMSYLEKIDGGVSYRTDGALGGIVTMQIPSIHLLVGYGYEASLQSELSRYVGGSHEVLLQFRW